MRRLPPLTAIEAFVQVARLGSIKAAASELALSAPALSRRVQALERFIGRPLFERRHQALALNEDGERLLGRLSPVLDSLSDAVEATTSGTEVLRLRLGVLPLWAAQRLFPRLGEGLDAAVVLAREIDPALHARRLDRNTVTVVGSRRLLERADPVTVPEQMAGLTALVHRDMPDNFTAWRRAAGVPALEPLATDHFDSGALMLEAAAQGLGVAFMHGSLYEDAHDTRLAPLFGVEVDSPYSNWFVCRPRALAQHPVRLFHDWLIRTIGAER